MIANYGYKDGSGDYFIAIDTDKCNGCNDCVSACPYGVMDVGPDENDPLSDEEVAFVTEAERKKIKYTCAPCKPMTIGHLYHVKLHVNKMQSHILGETLINPPILLEKGII